MSETPKVKLEIEVDPSAGLAALRKFEGSLEASAKKQLVSLQGMGDAFSFVAKGIGVATAAVGGLAAATVYLAKQGADVEKNEERAFAIMERRARMTDAAKDALLAFNSALQKSLGIDADNILSIQGTMSALGVSQGKIQDATKAALGLSAVFGKDLPESAELVGKVFAGDLPKGLKQIGVYATTSAGAQAQLSAMWKIAESQGQTFGSKVNAMVESFHDFEEALGGQVIKSDALRGAVDALQRAFESLTNWVQSPRGQIAIQEFFQTIVRWAGFAMQATAGLVNSLQDLKEKAVKGLMGEIFGKDSPEYKNTLSKLAGERFDMTTFQDLADSMVGAGTQRPQPGDPRFMGPVPPKSGPPPRRGGGNFGTGVEKKNTWDFTSPLPDWMVEDLKKRDQDNLHDVFEDYRARLAGEQSALEMESKKNGKNLHDTMADTFQDLGGTFAGSDELATKVLDVGKQAVANVGTMMADAIVSVANGSTSVLEAIGGFVGGVITMLGTMIIQLGTAALLASALSEIPIFAPLVGPPGVSAGVALAAIAGGAVLVAIGSAISGAAKGGSSAPAAGARPGPGAGGSNRGHGTPSTGRAFGSNIPGMGSYNPMASGGGDTVVNLNFNGPMGGSPRAIARSMEDILINGNTLRPGGRR